MESKLLALLDALVSCNSVNPTLAAGPGEAEVARLIARRLSGDGLAPVLQEVAPGRVNVVARVPGRGEAPPLLLNAHVDTVGAGAMAAPFTLRRVGDRLYGRGAYDMKGSAAVQLALGAHFAARPPPGDLWLTFVCDEEDRSLGTEHLVRHWLPTLPARPAGAFVLEPSEEAIAVTHKGFAWLEVTVAGRAAHGSRPDEGVDAALPLGAGLQHLAARGRALAEGAADPLLGAPSLHVSRLEGGSAWSIYPDRAVLQWERRTLPAEAPGVVEDELAAVTRAVAEAPGAHRADGRVVFARQAHRVAVDSLPVRLLQRAAPGAALGGVAFWTDAALFGAAGLPTVVYGPSGHGAHADDEWVSLGSLVRVYQVLVRALASPL